jgi:hypothetical protein
VKDNLLAPSVASGNWPPEDVWNTGFLDAYNDTLKYLAVEQSVRTPLDPCRCLTRAQLSRQ